MIRESVKGLLCLFILVGAVVSLFSWTESRPNHETWQYRIAGPVTAIVALSIFLLIHYQRDRVPDFLRAKIRTYFDRAGFCFAVVPAAQDGYCVFHVFFQNRFERPCRGRVGLRPAMGFLMDRAALPPVACEIECGPAAFGVATLRVPIPHFAQGTRQKFDVGASVEYPDGRGRRLRHREGMAIRHNSDFGNAFGKAIALAGAAAGVIVFSHPASVTMNLPAGVADTVPPDERPTLRTLWRLGDPVGQPAHVSA